MHIDMTIDFTVVDDDGLTHASLRDADDRARVTPGRHVVVADDDADPAVARVVELCPEDVVLLRVLPGTAAEHAHLVAREPA
jgi:hypothetical protein